MTFFNKSLRKLTRKQRWFRAGFKKRVNISLVSHRVTMICEYRHQDNFAQAH